MTRRKVCTTFSQCWDADRIQRALCSIGARIPFGKFQALNPERPSWSPSKSLRMPTCGKVTLTDLFQAFLQRTPKSWIQTASRALHEGSENQKASSRWLQCRSLWSSCGSRKVTFEKSSAVLSTCHYHIQYSNHTYCSYVCQLSYPKRVPHQGWLGAIWPLTLLECLRLKKLFGA